MALSLEQIAYGITKGAIDAIAENGVKLAETFRVIRQATFSESTPAPKELTDAINSEISAAADRAVAGKP